MANEHEKEIDELLTYGELKEYATDRAREAKNLLASQKNLQQKFQKVLTGLPLGLIIVENGDTIRVLNRRAAGFFEYEANELANKPISTLFPEIKKVETHSDSKKWMGRKKKRRWIRL